MIETAVEAPYRSVRHALWQAHAAEDWDLYKRPGYLRAMRSDCPSNGLDMTATDWCAQSAIVLSKVRDLPEHLAWTVTAHYTVDIPGRLRGKKLEAVIMLGRHVRHHEPEFSGYQPEFLQDGIRWWCGMGGARPDTAWADRLGVSDRTVRAMRLGNRRFRRRGLYHVLDGYMDAALEQLRTVFRRGGII